MNRWEDEYEPHRRHIEQLRAKYISGTATPQEIDQYWLEVLKDPEELELLKTEVNLRDLFRVKAGRN